MSRPYGALSGALQRAGYDDGELRQRYEQDVGRLDEQELERLYGRDAYRFLGGYNATAERDTGATTTRAPMARLHRQRDDAAAEDRRAEAFSVVPPYKARGRAQFRDRDGREYVVADYERAPHEAYVYIPVSETRARNARNRDRLEFPDEREWVTLAPVDRPQVEFRLQVRTVDFGTGRRASASVVFVQRLPTRDQYESETTRQRREHVDDA